MNKQRINELRKQFIADNDGKSTITLKSVFGKQQGATDICPVFDSLTERFLGVDEMPEEERKKSIRPVTGDTSRRLEDGLVIDFNRDIDVVDWNWMKECHQLAMSFEDSQMSNSALFYVYSEEKIIKERVKKTDGIFEALSLIKNASQTELAQRCRLIMGNTNHFSPLDIEDYLKETAMNNPSLITKIFSDPDFKAKLFLFDLMDAKIIVKNSKDKIYYFNERPLGSSEASVVEYLKAPENGDLVAHFKLEMDSKKK